MSERLNRKRDLRPDRLERRQAAVEKAWREQEARTVEAVPRGRAVRGSGCSPRASRKSDVTSPWLRVEDKTTRDMQGQGFRVARAHLTKIRSEALMNRQQPAYVFGFDRSGGQDREDWMAFPLPVAHTLLSVADAIILGDLEEARELAELLTRAG